MNDIKLTPQLSTLILNIKKYISQKKLSLDEFLYEVKLSNPKRITQQQFARIVQRINQLGQPINVSMLFTQLSKGSAAITRQTFISSFFKVFKIDRIHLQGQSMCLKPKGFKIQEKIANPVEQEAKRIALFGLTRLKHNMQNKRQKLDKIFSDCDINKSGFIDKIQLNKLLFASGIKQFKDKNIRRYLVHHIFDEMLKKQQMSKQQFFSLFQVEKTPKTKSIRGSVKAVKVTRGGTESTPKQRKAGKNVYINININQPGDYYINPQDDYDDPYGYDNYPPVRPRDPRIRPDPFDYDPRIRPDPFDYDPRIGPDPYDQYDNPKIRPKKPKIRPIDPYDLPYDPIYDPPNQQDGYQDQYYDNPNIKPKKPKIKPIDPYNNPKPKKPTNTIQEHPKFQIKDNLQNNVKAYPNAGKYYRLGVPSEQDKAYIQELERLLSSNKTFQDNKNPKTPGEYVTAQQIFDNQPFSLIDMSPEDMNSERKNLKIGDFIQANDVMQGQTGDCFFLCAIGSIAADYPQLLSELFLFEVNPASYYGVRLFIDGEWKVIKTDDLFACKPYGGQIFYAKPNNNEIWVMLLQKCYAKVYGSFKAINGGQQYESFFIMTGAPSIMINFDTQKNERVLKDKIISAEKSGYLMATAGTDYLSSLSAQQRQEIGLVQGHAYSMIFIKQINNTTLVKIRNPWGKFQWKGDWSYDSPLWTEQLRKQLGYTSKYQDGTFFMSWQDYYQYFGIITICKVNPLNVHTSFRMMNNHHKSNYVRMTVAKQGSYDIFICQESVRKFQGQNYRCSKSRLIILKEGPNGKFEYVGAASQFLWPITNVEVKLSPGNYMISAKVSWERWDDHECFLVAYGPQKVTFEKVNRTIADQFKEGIFPGFAAANRQYAQRGSYADSGYNGIQTETYFSMKEGIGYIKTTNKTKRAYSITITYQLGQLKVAAPKSNPYVLNIRPGQQDVLGFFVGPMGYQYAYQYNIQVK